VGPGVTARHAGFHYPAGHGTEQAGTVLPSGLAVPADRPKSLISIVRIQNEAVGKSAINDYRRVARAGGGRRGADSRG